MSHRSPGIGLRLRIAASVLLVSLLAVAVAVGTHSAFTSTDSNSGNSAQAATISLGDNTGGSALFSLLNLVPGVINTKCVQVSYTGNAPGGVHVAISATGNVGGLAPYLNLELVRGSFTGTPSAGSCTGFTPDTGGGVLFNGALSTLTSTIADTNSAWTNGTKVGYELVATQLDNNLAQSQSISPTFTWQAINN